MEAQPRRSHRSNMDIAMQVQEYLQSFIQQLKWPNLIISHDKYKTFWKKAKEYEKGTVAIAKATKGEIMLRQVLFENILLIMQIYKLLVVVHK